MHFDMSSVVYRIFSRRTLTKCGTGLHLPSSVILGGSHSAGSFKSGLEYSVGVMSCKASSHTGLWYEVGSIM